MVMGTLNSCRHQKQEGDDVTITIASDAGVKVFHYIVYKLNLHLFVGWTRRRYLTGITVAICWQLHMRAAKEVRRLVRCHFASAV